MAERSKQLPARATEDEVRAFLDKLRALPPAPRGAGRGRLIFAMDATASRGPTWDHACRIQGEMFEAAKELGGLEIQLAYYRGMGEFAATPWLANSAELVRRMTSVFCLGGETQIRKVLRHAIAETDKRRVNAVVFVGDCMEEDVDELCRLAGELGLRGVPVFVFHEGDDPVARRAFLQIARLTGGAYCPFDPASPARLAELLKAVAVFAAGGNAALTALERKGGAAAEIAAQIRHLPRS